MTKREKIFHAGAKLFAERSFNSVGIRDIAREADVNSAMISYYFGGKAGLLREIFTSFKERMIEVIRKSMTGAKDHDELVELNVAMFLDDARQNRDVYLIGLRELNHDSPELQDLRDGLYNSGWELFEEFLARTGGNIKHPEDVRDITFTAVIGTIFSDYLLGGGNYIDDDDKVGAYKEIVTALLKSGSPALWG
ncbi:TetR/AcrR family transcriptional regulator [Desulfovibrio sp. JC010]|uniref:TetR/AcrR family transcriptional regulator n=1 Tax=Desulfovibrio sp. JC010 TaxID=2593641 RepID=UPI0013D86A00|nr:TetR/AcrR family transcriptional regulator [Desulfovibrio sp. JC010]NDV26132.1 TetR/AcrR family transcriptional regulator [Desulfovibrio sp. JC010]